MANGYVIFEGGLYNGRLERRFFSYCLKRQPWLIIYLPIVLLANFLNYFHLLPRKIYLQWHWAFLKKVKKLDAKLTKYGRRISKKLRYPVEGLTVVSEHPDIVIEKLIDGDFIANIYKPRRGKFEDFKRAGALVPEGGTVYGGFFSPIMRKAKKKVYFYKNKMYTSAFSWLAAGFFRFFTALIIMLAFCAVLEFVSLYFVSQFYDDSTVLLKAYYSHIELLILNYLPILVVTVFLYFLTNSTGIACGISGIICTVMSLVDYYKVAIRGDNFVFEDLFNIREGGAMMGQYTIDITPKKALVFVVVVAAAAVIHLFLNAKIRVRYIRPLLLVGVVFLAFSLLEFMYFDSEKYVKIQADIFAEVKETAEMPTTESTKFASHGFLYPYIYSYYSYQMSESIPPEGYSEEGIRELLSQYEDLGIPEKQKVNVIGIMLESFGDFSAFEHLDFKIDVYKNFNDLKRQSYSGYLFSDIYAADTIKTERSFLSGFYIKYLPNYGRKINSYVWYMRDQGYTTEGSHPSQKWFYRRSTVNNNMGFENYHFDEDTFLALNKGVNNAGCSVMFPELLRQYKTAIKEDKNYFQFNVTYEGHGPYSATERHFSREYISDEGISEADYNIVNNYMEMIYNTNVELKKFIDELRKIDEPVVVVLFGDHMPGLGENGSTYASLGINVDENTINGLLNKYKTPYLIWGNGAAKRACGNSFRGKGDMIGSYLLMNKVFELCGWQGSEYMQYMNEFVETTGITAIHSSGWYLKNGEITHYSDFSKKEKAALEGLDRVQYYWKNHFDE